MQYLILLDNNNKRITSLVTGIHGDTKDDLISYAKKEFKTNKYVWGGQDVQDEYLNKEQEKLKLTAEELKKNKTLHELQLKEDKLKKDLDEINKEYVTALLDNDVELQEELKAERAELLKEA